MSCDQVSGDALGQPGNDWQAAIPETAAFLWLYGEGEGFQRAAEQGNGGDIEGDKRGGANEELTALPM